MEEAGKRGEPAKHGLEKTSMQKISVSQDSIAESFVISNI